ncbi:aldehyde dehydrogenase family protein [Aspergillus clavatus NRRL 1]|uniref:aldehyde dehydrogenase (NAD(+)) n=1 Tax=Aspergillus clavatus (strain ATCC 1007 / CBS 513.65 / DSM 816 / NCTC 3887 / NRRL 1 / QM 1276 / 107) TaxID=344612 RepID=A1C9N6_ASPCL|nr:aldehyde dehydrogenase [Aspergillus clavatus NRRL 1]EAW13560.1 aldehyde dehydrogenase [Aspergillus clavatus NRRL 1]
MSLNATTFHNVINNELTSTSQTRYGINPANREPNPEVPVSTQDDLDRAVDAARQAFQKWSKTSFDERRIALSAFADKLEANKDMIAQLLTQEQGKPLSQSAVEVGMATQWTRTLTTTEIPESVIEETEERKIIQRYTPLGVCGGIVPWNFPVLLAVSKIVPAVYTGNTIIFKPSPLTPYCGLKLAELAAQCFPPGVVQALSGGDDLGPMITEHPGIDKISFTGSIPTGKLVMASCAKTLKRVTLELGGNDPAIVCDDVDIDAVVPKVGILSFLCASQICMVIKRLYVHEKIYDEFRDKLVAFVQSLKVGEGTQPDVFFGPVQNSMQYDKAKDLYSSISTEGLKAVLGGTIQDSAGYFITPTIIDNPPESARVVQEEAFAPILPIMKWSDEDDVLARANGTETGLGSSVWSKDPVRARRMADRLESGSVWINSHFDLAPNVPFGGHKSSGIGTEWGLSGLTAYCNSQSLWIKANV